MIHLLDNELVHLEENLGWNNDTFTADGVYTRHNN